MSRIGRRKPTFSETRKGKPFFERMRRFRYLSIHWAFKVSPAERPNVVEELRSSGGKPISIAELALKLEVPPFRLRPLIQNEYLRVVIPSAKLESTIVAHPHEDALQWLKQMFCPLIRQPFVRLADVHDMIKGYKGRKIERDATARLGQLCMMYGIPLLFDPVFGELLTIEGLNQLLIVQGIAKKAGPKSRVGMLSFLLQSLPHRSRPSSNGDARWKKQKEHEIRATFEVPKYYQRLELEINRIAHLPEPQRTIRAVSLREAWRDARTVSRLLGDYRKIADRFTREGIGRVDREVEELHRFVIEQLDQEKKKKENDSTGSTD